MSGRRRPLKRIRPRALALPAIACLFAACGKGDQPPAAVGEADAVVVFAAYEDRRYLPALFADFTRATGVPVIVRHAPAATIVADVIDNVVSPPADLLWTPDVASIFAAAEEGALRPISSAALAGNVPAGLRDPDDFWVGLSYRMVAIATDAERYTDETIAGYESLAASRFANALCLSSAGIADNVGVLATMLDRLGTRPAERAVRGWVANLARPIYPSEAELVDALAAGDCGAAIATTAALAAAGVDRSRIRLIVPPQPAFDAEAVGIARHAENPDGAAVLLEWLTESAVQARHAAAVNAYPANGDATAPAALESLGLEPAEPARIMAVAAYARDARLLAGRTGYRE